MKKIIACFTLVLTQMFSGLAPAHRENTYNLTGRIDFTPAEVRAWQFLHGRMLDENGVISYLVNPKKASANCVFESMGQAMEYLALIGDAELFARYARITDRYFRAKEGYYYWEVSDHDKKGAVVTALIDDVRLFRAYYMAHEKKMGDYTAKLQALADEIYRFDVNWVGSDDYAVSWYNREEDGKDTGVDLFYLDVETMEQMARYDERWGAPVKNARKILLDIPKNRFGFYPARFEIAEGKFPIPPRTNMIENLYTALFAHYAGADTKPFSEFLKKEIARGRIHNIYDTKSGKPLTKEGECTAVYALAARFLDLSGEGEAALKCYNRTLSLQIGVDRAFMGGFSMDEDESVYAFDQLEALLMLRLVDPATAGIAR